MQHSSSSSCMCVYCCGLGVFFYLFCFPVGHEILCLCFATLVLEFFFSGSGKKKIQGRLEGESDFSFVRFAVLCDAPVEPGTALKGLQLGGFYR